MNDTARHIVEQTFPVADRDGVGDRQFAARSRERTARAHDDGLSWPDRRTIYVQVVEDDGYWYAEALEFRTLATGATHDEALDILFAKLRTYFGSCRAEKRSKQEVLRPGTTTRYLKVRALSLLARLTGSLFVSIERVSLSHVESVPRHS